MKSKYSPQTAVKTARKLGVCPIQMQLELGTRVDPPKASSWDEAYSMYKTALDQRLKRYQPRLFKMLFDLTSDYTQVMCIFGIEESRFRMSLLHKKLNEILRRETRRAKTIQECVAVIGQSQKHTPEWLAAIQKLWKVALVRIRKTHSLEGLYAIVVESNWLLYQHGCTGCRLLSEKWYRASQKEFEGTRDSDDLIRVYTMSMPDTSVREDALRALADKIQTSH